MTGEGLRGAPGGGLTYDIPSGAVALVTGGSRGIGRAISLQLAALGYDIWLNYASRDDTAEEVRRTIVSLGRECTLLKFDVSDADGVTRNLEPLVEERTPHVLVNNAGIIRDGVLALMSFDDWKRVLQVTLDGFFLVTRVVLNGMLLQRRGRIVNISSTSGQAGLAGQTNYSAAKAGLIGATKSLAAEVARRGILANVVAPGLIATDLTKDIEVERILPAIPLRRLGTVEEVAGIVAFLCSKQASYVTGQVIGCNGGLYM